MYIFGKNGYMYIILLPGREKRNTITHIQFDKSPSMDLTKRDEKAKFNLIWIITGNIM